MRQPGTLVPGKSTESNLSRGATACATRLTHAVAPRLTGALSYPNLGLKSQAFTYRSSGAKVRNFKTCESGFCAFTVSICRSYNQGPRSFPTIDTII